MGASVLVESEERHGHQQIMPDGKKGQYFMRLPKETTRIFNYQRLELQKVQEGVNYASFS